MIIRPETPRDYAMIARVNQRAFEQRLSESLIVALHRHRLSFDPELSLVAEENGEIIGHVLFTPHTLRLLGENLRAVNLAPIAIDPAYQRQGIGAKLIEEGHRVAHTKGYQISFLLGHPEYYVKFGYRTHAYGSAALEVDVQQPPANHAITVRDVQEADIPYLVTLWMNQMRQVDFTTLPEPTLTDWQSPNPRQQAKVYIHSDQLIGYTRGDTQSDITNPSVTVFLARDGESARAILPIFAPNTRKLKLPLHPLTSWIDGFGQAISTPWAAGMAYALSADTSFDAYYARVQSNEHPAGQAIWGAAFDL